MFSFVHLQTCPCNSGCIHSFNHSIMGLCSRSSVHSSCQFISFHLVIHSFARSVLATHFWICSNYYDVPIAYIYSLSYSCTNVLLFFYLMFIPLLIRSLTCLRAVDPCMYVLFNYMHKFIYVVISYMIYGPVLKWMNPRHLFTFEEKKQNPKASTKHRNASLNLCITMLREYDSHIANTSHKPCL